MRSHENVPTVRGSATDPRAHRNRTKGARMSSVWTSVTSPSSMIWSRSSTDASMKASRGRGASGRHADGLPSRRQRRSFGRVRL